MSAFGYNPEKELQKEKKVIVNNKKELAEYVTLFTGILESLKEKEDVLNKKEKELSRQITMKNIEIIHRDERYHETELLKTKKRKASISPDDMSYYNDIYSKRPHK